jgi:hypothetical protein
MNPYMLVSVIAALAALGDLVRRHEATSQGNGPALSAFPPQDHSAGDVQ